ncbi:MAG: M48 family metallopeptidase [Bacteroidota bacterium]
MKYYSRLLLYFFLMAHFQSSAQQIDLKNYKPLKSEGAIPNDFISSFSKKYEEGKTQIVDEKKRSIRKSKDEFLVSSSFYLNELLRSGKVLFGDPVTNYVNDVADVLLKDFPELREQLRFYTTKSPQVNAFSTDQGIIFVNLGLIAQVENEAQLAYVIAHEIIHFVKKHNMELYVFTDKLERKSNVGKRTNYEGLMLNKSFRSKESEFESDREGLTSYFLKTGYSLKSVNSAFDVLLYSYLPFDEVPFEKSFFETSFFHFPANYILDSLSAVDAEKYLNEESATHPSIYKRRETMLGLINEQKKDAGKEFILSESRFREVQNLARFESVRLKIIDMKYISALYDCFLLLKTFPDNRFLEISKAACLYSLSRYKTEWKTASQTSYKKIQGESQQIFYFLQKLNKKELNILALATCWRAKQKFSDSEYLKLICEELIEDLALANKTKFSYFLTESPTDSARIIENAIDTTSKSKYDKIKAKQKKSGFDGDFLRTAMIDIINDTAFISEYKRIEALSNENE